MNLRLGKYEMAEISKLFSEIGCVLTLGAMEYILGQKNPTVFAGEVLRKLKEKKVYGRVLTKEDLLNGGKKEEVLEDKLEVEEIGVKEVEIREEEVRTEEVMTEELHDISEVLPEEGVEEEEIFEEEKPEISGEYEGARKYKEREEYPGDLEIFKIEEEELYSKGDMGSFVEYFKDRYRRLKEILLERLRKLPEKVRVIGIEDLTRYREEEVIVLGIVTDVRAFSTSYLLQVQDETGFISVKVPRDREGVFFFVGDVVAFRGFGNGKYFRVKDSKKGVIFPSFPFRRRKEPEELEPLKIAITSDIHVGSKYFMKDEFESFISWINKSEEAGGIKYLIVAGDLVDGVGVYPGQEKELEEVDVYKQYETLIEYLSEIDESIYVLLMPGNHDLVRQSLPQPEIRFEDLERDLPRNVIPLQNPSFLKFFQDFRLLLLHGRPLEDLFSKVPGAKHEHPTEMMKVILERRHLCPVYGEKTPIQPLPKDHLVISDEMCPDVFVTGHVHTFEYSFYKRACLINASAWQRQTEYQRTRGIVPNPGKVVILDVEKFYRPGGEDPVIVRSFSG